jgi:flagellar protein FlgJ
MAIDPTNLKAAGAIGLRKKMDPAAQDKKLHEVAELYEQQFLREMVKAMRGTVPEGGLMKASQGEQIYKEQLDNNYVEQWSQKGGLGLQGIIYQQLVDKYGPSMGIKAQDTVPKGPIALDAKSTVQNPFSVKSAPSATGSTRFEFEKNPAAGAEPTALKAPWAGRVLGVKEFNPNEYALEIAHDNGLKSQFVFRGSLSGQALATSENEGQNVQAGETIGLLNPEAKRFFWNVSHDLPPTDLQSSSAPKLHGLMNRNPSALE